MLSKAKQQQYILKIIRAIIFVFNIKTFRSIKGRAQISLSSKSGCSECLLRWVMYDTEQGSRCLIFLLKYFHACWNNEGKSGYFFPLFYFLLLARRGCVIFEFRGVCISYTFFCILCVIEIAEMQTIMERINQYFKLKMFILLNRRVFRKICYSTIQTYSN